MGWGGLGWGGIVCGVSDVSSTRVVIPVARLLERGLSASQRAIDYTHRENCIHFFVSLEL